MRLQQATCTSTLEHLLVPEAAAHLRQPAELAPKKKAKTSKKYSAGMLQLLPCVLHLAACRAVLSLEWLLQPVELAFKKEGGQEQHGCGSERRAAPALHFALRRLPLGSFTVLSDRLITRCLQEPVKPAPKKKAKTSNDADVSAAQGSATIFIKNLPWSATEDELYEFLKSAGEAVEVRIGALLAFTCVVRVQLVHQLPQVKHKLASCTSSSRAPARPRKSASVRCLLSCVARAQGLQQSLKSHTSWQLYEFLKRTREAAKVRIGALLGSLQAVA